MKFFKNYYSPLFILVFFLLWGCQDNTTPVQSITTTGQTSFSKKPPSNKTPDVIDFEGIEPGTIVDQVYGASGTGPIGVYAFNDQLTSVFPAGANAAVIFPSADPPGIDFDLGTPNETFGGPGIGSGGEMGMPYENALPLGNILIINEAPMFVDRDGNHRIDNSDSPVIRADDADRMGSYIDFDFSTTANNNGTVTVNSVTIMDVEREEGEDGTFIELSGPNLPVNLIAIPPTGDNGVVVIDGIGLSGVSHMRVQMNGSGAVADIVINQGENRTCWITTGGFHNAGVQSGGKNFTFGGNVGPPPSGSWEVIDHNTGDNFHSNDVHIDSCVVINEGGPGQPGGKKGFKINKAYFSGIGRLNQVDGYPFTGFVVDRGEPSGKKGKLKDQFHIEVYDPVTHAIVFFTEFELDGGNVQIHPCSGNQCN
ncbi:MAG: hypothetical protein Kow0042_01600 [Calditrichia bacterium]